MVAEKRSAQEHFDAQAQLKSSFVTEGATLGFLSQFAKGSKGIISDSVAEFDTDTTSRNMRSIGRTAEENLSILAQTVSTGFSVPPEEADELSQVSLFGKATQEDRLVLSKLESVMGAKAFDTFLEDNGNILLQAAINGLMEHDPASVNAFLDSAAAEALAGPGLTDEEKTEIRKDAKDFLEKKQQVREIELARTHAENEGQMQDDARTGKTPTLTEIENASVQNLISNKFAEKMRKFKKSKNRKKLGSNPRTFFEIEKMFEKFVGAKKADEAEKIPTEQFMLERVWAGLRWSVLV